MRLFLGIKPTKQALLAIQKLIKTLQAKGIAGNYTDINNIHLTLVFVGETEETNKLKSIMNGINSLPFSFQMNKLTKLKDMFVLEIEKTKELDELQTRLTDEIIKQGYPIEKRNFYPHITLVREVKEDLNMNIAINSEVKSFELYLSERIQGKIKYSIVHKKILGCEKSD